MVGLQRLMNEPYALLISDDDGVYLDALRTTLEPRGYRTHLAHSGREAIAVARSNVVHAAILDMEMPDLTGLETMQIIVQEIGEPMPFVIVSGEISKDVMLRAMSAHAYSFVPKPFNAAFLLEVVRRMLEGYYGIAPSEGTDSNGESAAFA